jgi:murein DD-endopeptidase MepM/ murein hydrolase activator NlpD
MGTDPLKAKMHEGMDFTAKSGTPIYATGDGMVYKSR